VSLLLTTRKTVPNPQVLDTRQLSNPATERFQDSHHLGGSKREESNYREEKGREILRFHIASHEKRGKSHAVDDQTRERSD